MDCIFCKILRGEIPSKKVYEDDEIYAFYDIEPKAPVHILVIPKVHLSGASAVSDENSGRGGPHLRGHPQNRRRLGLSDYRIVTNNGPDAGQTVSHLHFHVLAGGKLGEMA